MTNKIIAFTGHRSEKIGGYVIPNSTYNRIFEETEKLLLQLKPEKCISGMALGMDQLACEVCIKLGIPFTAAIPFIGQEGRWPLESRNKYSMLLNMALDKVIVCEGEYAPWKMQRRNEYMVDQCDEIIACFDGSYGGTYNCIQYAKSKNKTIHIIDPSLL